MRSVQLRRRAAGVGVAAVSLGLVQFVDVLGVTVVVTSLPAMLASLHAPQSYASLIATGYAMFFGGLLMLGARLGDRFGHRRTILVSLLVFTACAVLGATASSALVLMAGRWPGAARRRASSTPPLSSAPPSGQVEPLLTAPAQAVWLLPTPGFRRAAFGRRGSLWEIARKTSQPDKALGNLLERDRMFTERLDEETRRLELRVINVDTAMTEDFLTERVMESFGL